MVQVANKFLEFFLELVSKVMMMISLPFLLAGGLFLWFFQFWNGSFFFLLFFFLVFVRLAFVFVFPFGSDEISKIKNWTLSDCVKLIMNVVVEHFLFF